MLWAFMIVRILWNSGPNCQDEHEMGLRWLRQRCLVPHHWDLGDRRCSIKMFSSLSQVEWSLKIEHFSSFLPSFGTFKWRKRIRKEPPSLPNVPPPKVEDEKLHFFSPSWKHSASHKGHCYHISGSKPKLETLFLYSSHPVHLPLLSSIVKITLKFLSLSPHPLGTLSFPLDL